LLSIVVVSLKVSILLDKNDISVVMLLFIN